MISRNMSYNQVSTLAQQSDGEGGTGAGSEDKIEIIGCGKVKGIIRTNFVARDSRVSSIRPSF